jgi:hypothetical protein
MQVEYLALKLRWETASILGLEVGNKLGNEEIQSNGRDSKAGLFGECT